MYLKTIFDIIVYDDIFDYALRPNMCYAYTEYTSILD